MNNFRPLRVDMLSTGATGSGVAALRLHRCLDEFGVESRLWNKPPRKQSVPTEQATDSGIQFVDLTEDASSWGRLRARIDRKLFKRKLRGRPANLEIFTSPLVGLATRYDPNQFSGDLLHLHWVNNWLDWPTFFAGIPDDLPVIWTLHDMGVLTGGCHHADGCERFHDGCGNCPQLSETQRGPADLSRQFFQIKHSAYAGKNLHIVTPSRWMQRHAENSGLVPHASVQTIYNGLDVREFSPRDKMVARKQLGLPDDKTVVLFGAASEKNRRKGMPEFFDAMSRVSDPNIECVSFGSPCEERSGRVPVRSLGYLNGAEELSRVYSAADILVMPSLGENMPQTVVESMACGTPVVAFDVGGIPEIVRPGESGMLAPLGDCIALADGIRWMMDHPQQRKHMGTLSRKIVESEFDSTRQAERYVGLYREVTKSGDWELPNVTSRDRVA